MITINSYDSLGQVQGTCISIDIFMEEFAEEVFSNGGHAELWNDEGRIFDDPSTTIEELQEQIGSV